jgi:hypothetical protein
MDGSEIDAVRALLNSKPRPVGWVQRRERLDEVGSIWPVADDVNLDLVDLDGVRWRCHERKSGFWLVEATANFWKWSRLDLPAVASASCAPRKRLAAQRHSPRRHHSGRMPKLCPKRRINPL